MLSRSLQVYGEAQHIVVEVSALVAPQSSLHATFGSTLSQLQKRVCRTDPCSTLLRRLRAVTRPLTSYTHPTLMVICVHR